MTNFCGAGIGASRFLIFGAKVKSYILAAFRFGVIGMGLIQGAIGVAQAQTISTVAGSLGSSGSTGDGGPANAAKLRVPYHIAVDGSGNIYISDQIDYVIRKFSVGGTINTIAGKFGTSGYSGDGGAAGAAKFQLPAGLAVDTSGNIFVADPSSNVVRKINAVDGTINTVAGTGTAGATGDGGPAIAAKLSAPYALAVDGGGNLFIVDRGNHAIRKVNAGDGKINTFAGSLGASGSSGDSGPATSAKLNTPSGLAIDGVGNLFIADSGNNVIREVTAGDGKIKTVAGLMGSSGPNAAGASAISTRLNGPTGIAVDAAGNIYFVDTGNNQVNKFAVGGTMSRIAGTGTSGATGDGGAATAATLSNPNGIAIDSSGNIFIADTFNAAIRMVASVGSSTPSLTAQTIRFNAPFPGTVGGNGALTATASSGLTVTFTSNTPSICTVSGNSVAYIAAGTCSITASQPGNATYAAATPVTQSLTVSGSVTAITITSPAIASSPTPTISGTATAGGNISINIDGKIVGLVSANANGVWSFNVTSALAAGTHTVIASDTSNPGQTGTTTFTLTVSSLPAQTISFTAPSTGLIGGTATLTATASSGLTVSLLSTTPGICAITGTTVSYISAGTCSITASQAGNTSFAPAPNVIQTITVNALITVAVTGPVSTKSTTPTITGTAPAGDTISISIDGVVIGTTTASQTGTWSFVVTGALITGTHSVIATDTTASPNVTSSAFSLTISALTPQTISFTAPSTGTIGAGVVLTANASSGLTVNLSSTTPSICVLNGKSVSYLAAGTCSITASQAGNTTFAAAAPVTQTIIVSAAVIVTVTGPATSNTTKPTITGMGPAGDTILVTIDGIIFGTTTVSQAGTWSYTVATAVTADVHNVNATDTSVMPNVRSSTFVMTISVPKAQLIAFMAPATGTVGGMATLTATASSGLAVSFLSTTPTICLINGNSVSYLATGTCIIAASQPGNANFTPAATVSQSIIVIPVQTTQTINFVAPSNGIIFGSSNLTALATSGLTVTFASTTPAICLVSGNSVAYLAIGTCSITASQTGSAYFSAAPNVIQTINVNSVPVTIIGPASTTSVTPTITGAAGAGDMISISVDGASLGIVKTATDGTWSYAPTRALTRSTHLVVASDNTVPVAAPATLFVVIAPAKVQAISFAPPGTGGIGGTITLSATTSSGLAVTFASTTSSICTMSGNVLTFNAVGTCMITAAQAGDDTYLSAGVTQSINVIKPTKLPVIITGPAYTNLTAPTITGTGAPGDTISLSIDGRGFYETATVNSAGVWNFPVSNLATGTHSIVASDTSGQPNLISPPFTTVVSKGNPQTLSFSAPPAEFSKVGTQSNISVTASSGLPVTLTSQTPAVCGIFLTIVLYKAAGACTITGYQAGDSTYAPISASQSYQVTSTRFHVNLPQNPVGSFPIVTGTAGPGDQIIISFFDHPYGVNDVENLVLDMFGGSGIYKYNFSTKADANGNWSFKFQNFVNQALDVQLHDVTENSLIEFPMAIGWLYQTLAFDPPSDGVAVLGATAVLSATATSGLPVTFSSSTPSICSVSGNKIAYLSAGFCTVSADQAGNMSNDGWLTQTAGQTFVQSFAPADTIERSFVVTKSGSTIPVSVTQSRNSSVQFVTGTAPPGDTISVALEGGYPPGTAMADSQGVWAFKIPFRLPYGYYIVHAIDVTTNIAAPSFKFLGGSVGRTGTSITAFIAKDDPHKNHISPVGDSATLIGQVRDGGAIIYKSNTPKICAILDSTVAFLNVGDCKITATSTGNDLVYPSSFDLDTEQVIPVARVTGPATTTSQTPTISGFASSGDMVSIGISAPNYFVSGVVRTSADGTWSYVPTIPLPGGAYDILVWDQTSDPNGAYKMPFSMYVSAGQPQTISFAQPPAGLVGTTVSLTATSSAGSNYPVAFSSNAPAVCAIFGNTVTYIAAGTCSIIANQAGDGIVNAASATLSVNVTKPAVFGNPTITGPVTSSSITPTIKGSGTVGDVIAISIDGVTLGTATADANGSWSYLVQNPLARAAHKVVATDISLTPNVASGVFIMTVSPATAQTISFTLPTSAAAGGTATLSATASSGLGVKFVTTTPAICGLSGVIVTYANAGTCSILAYTLGDNTYAPAQITQSIIVGPAANINSSPSTSAGPDTNVATLSKDQQKALLGAVSIIGNIGGSANAASSAAAQTAIVQILNQLPGNTTSTALLNILVSGNLSQLSTAVPALSLYLKQLSDGQVTILAQAASQALANSRNSAAAALPNSDYSTTHRIAGDSATGSSLPIAPVYQVTGPAISIFNGTINLSAADASGAITTIPVPINISSKGEVSDLVAISRNKFGYFGNGASTSPVLSRDGQVVAYSSLAGNLGVMQQTGQGQVLRYSQGLGAVDTASQSSSISGTFSGSNAAGQSLHPALSADSNILVFASDAPNIYPFSIFAQPTVRQLYMTAANSAFGPTTLSPNPISTVNGKPVAYAVDRPALSVDGTVMAFDTGAALVANMTAGVTQVYVKNLANGAVSLASSSSFGEPGNAASFNASISDDGRYVLFESDASNLIATAPGSRQIYVKDMTTGLITLVSGVNGIPGNAQSLNAKLSGQVPYTGSGLYAVFESDAGNLVKANTGGQRQVYLANLATGKISLVSADAAGMAVGGAAPAISGDGRFVVYKSAGPVTALPAPANAQIYVNDAFAGKTLMVSTDTSGLAGNGASDTPAISADGRTIAFSSLATNLDGSDTNSVAQVYIAANSLNAPLANGFWVNPNLPGQYYLVEQSGNKLWFALLGYGNDNSPLWSFASESGLPGGTFQGSLFQTAGGPTLAGLGGPAYSSGNLGSTDLGAGNPVAGRAVLNGALISIQRNDFVSNGTSMGQGAGYPETGWWYSAATAQSMFLDVQGTTLFSTVLSYDANGKPVWYQTSGVMTAKTAYSGSLFACTATTPPTCKANIGPIALTFTSTLAGTMTLPGGNTVPIQRWRF